MSVLTYPPTNEDEIFRHCTKECGIITSTEDQQYFALGCISCSEKFLYFDAFIEHMQTMHISYENEKGSYSGDGNMSNAMINDDSSSMYSGHNRSSAENNRKRHRPDEDDSGEEEDLTLLQPPVVMIKEEKIDDDDDDDDDENVIARPIIYERKI